MAVPKRRTSRTKRDQRRANHDKISAVTIGRCPNCGEMKLPHRVCGACGTYDGKQVVAKAQPEASTEG